MFQRQGTLALAQLALGKDKESLAYEYVLSMFQGCSLMREMMYYRHLVLK